jgi:hypothetical protein
MTCIISLSSNWVKPDAKPNQEQHPFSQGKRSGQQNGFPFYVMPPDERLMKACQLDLFISEFLKIIQL